MHFRYRKMDRQTDTAITTSLDKLENKVKVHHLHLKRFHTGEKIAKISPVHCVSKKRQ